MPATDMADPGSATTSDATTAAVWALGDAGRVMAPTAILGDHQDAGSVAGGGMNPKGGINFK